MSYMYVLASLYTQYFVKCPTQDSQVDWPMANGTILLKIKIHSFIHHLCYAVTAASSALVDFTSVGNITLGSRSVHVRQICKAAPAKQITRTVSCLWRARAHV